MKRFLSILLVAVLSVGLMATSAMAAGVEIGEPKVSGSEATVTLTAKDVKFQSCFATINYDHSKLTLTKVAAGEIISGAKDVSAVKEASEVEGVSSMYAWNDDHNGKAEIAYASAKDVDANGIMFTLTFTVAEGAEDTVKADITFYDANGGEGAPVAIDATSNAANIKVEAQGTVKKGDVTGDGKINAADRAYLARYLAGWAKYATIDEEAADVTGDGKVNAADRAYLARYLAGWSKYQTLG